MGYVTLWQLPDEENKNVSVRARMKVGDKVIDETIAVPISDTTDEDSGVAIEARMAELAKGGVETTPEAEQIIVPASEVQL